MKIYKMWKWEQIFFLGVIGRSLQKCDGLFDIMQKKKHLAETLCYNVLEVLS